MAATYFSECSFRNSPTRMMYCFRIWWRGVLRRKTVGFPGEGPEKIWSEIWRLRGKYGDQQSPSLTSVVSWATLEIYCHSC